LSHTLNYVDVYTCYLFSCPNISLTIPAPGLALGVHVNPTVYITTSMKRSSQSGTSSQPFKKRKLSQMNYIKRRLRELKPETKTYIGAVNIASVADQAVNIVSMTDGITQGNARNERIGDEIKILGFELTGLVCGDASGDCLVLQKRSNDAVTVAEFSANVGTQCDDATQKTLWRYTSDQTNYGNIRYTHRFKYPLLVKYSGDNTIRNELVLAHPNFTGQAMQGVSMGIKVYFQDS